MKKHIAILLCIITVMSLIACDFDEEQNNTAIQSSDTEKVMETFESAIKGEISVLDERQGETKLNSLRFQRNGTSLEESKLLKKAILDIDQDGVNEYVIKSPSNEYIVLRYHNGNVYSYRLDSNDYYKLNTDGTFYWYDSSEEGEWKCGLDQIFFNREQLSVKHVYSINYTKNPAKYEYFVEGKSVSENEYYDYRTQNISKERMIFSWFELTNSYPITAEEAWNLANAYWDNQDGCKDAGAGTIWTVRIELIDTPNAEKDYYSAAFQVESTSNGGGEGDECKPPYQIKLYDEILVNAHTGEIIPSTYESECKGVTINEAIEIAKSDCDFIDFDSEKNEYRVEYDVNATAPDHIYVIVIQECLDDGYSVCAIRWIDKNTGGIIFPYYLNGK